MSSKQAIASALSFRASNGKPLPRPHLNATEISYQSAQRSLAQDMDARVATDRCVWKVTVDATYSGFPGPPPRIHNASVPAVTPARASSYSVMFDVNSGFMFEIVAGR
jgi:hypothetical protein